MGQPVFAVQAYKLSMSIIEIIGVKHLIQKKAGLFSPKLKNIHFIAGNRTILQNGMAE